VTIVAAVSLALPMLSGPTTETFTTTVVVMIAAYSLAAYAPSRRSWVAPLIVLTAAACLRSAVDYGFDVYPVISGVAWTGAAFAGGVVMRAQRGRADVAEQRREEHAIAAVAAERARIARDLHDVVSHAISVIVLQARGGRRMLVVDPAESRAAFDTVEDMAEQAMAEMRRLLGLLRETSTGDATTDLAARPSLAHLGELSAQVPGSRVTIAVSGDLSSLPPSVDLAAYRIVQEALTNVRRHAEAGSVDVAVKVDGSAVELAVVDDGRGPTGKGGGYGLLGMRERATLYGGTFDAGPRPGGGFAVRACLPYTAVPA
jgi:signal transduction histidine kinase